MARPASPTSRPAAWPQLRRARAADVRACCFWPEAAVTEPLARRAHRPRTRQLSEFERTRARRQSGAGRISAHRRHSPCLERRQHAVAAATNSVFVLAPGGTLIGRYDKAHLVPYGEYLPMRPLLSAIGLSRLAPGDVDFAAGPGPRTLDLPGWGKVGLQICYEIIFSGEVVDRRNRPDFIFNPSNDAWFGALGPAAASRPGAASRGRGRAAGDPLDPDRDQRRHRRARRLAAAAPAGARPA